MMRQCIQNGFLALQAFNETNSRNLPSLFSVLNSLYIPQVRATEITDPLPSPPLPAFGVLIFFFIFWERQQRGIFLCEDVSVFSYNQVFTFYLVRQTSTFTLKILKAKFVICSDRCWQLVMTVPQRRPVEINILNRPGSERPAQCMWRLSVSRNIAEPDIVWI